MDQEFLKRFYSTQRNVKMTVLTSSKQWKDGTGLDYINRWCALSLKCKDELSETSDVEMVQDLLYVLQMRKPLAL